MLRLARRYSSLTGKAAELEAVVQKYLLHPETENANSALISCVALENAHYASEANALLGDILKRRPSLQDKSVHEFFCNASPELGMKLLKDLTLWGKALPESTLMIPFRRAIYTAKFREALDIMDLVAGDKGIYAKQTTSKLRKLGIGWSVVMGGVLSGVDALLTSGLVGTWSQRPLILSMVGVYLTSLSVYGMLSAGNARTGSLGTALEWTKGTSLLYRYRHSRQMRMSNVLVEVNRSLPENRGEASPKLLRDLRDRQLQAVETADEASLKEFWARGGAGFEWVEPDQDPADLRFMRRMEETKFLREGSPYSRRDEDGKLLTWAEDLAKEQQNKSIPHASLLHVDELKTPEKLDKIEAELARAKGLDPPISTEKLPKS